MTSESRACERPDGTLVVRTGTTVAGHDAPEPPPGATPLVAAPGVDGDDARVDILAEQLCEDPRRCCGGVRADASETVRANQAEADVAGVLDILSEAGYQVDGTRDVHEQLREALRGGGTDGGGEVQGPLRSLAAAVAASDKAPDMGLTWLTDYIHAETEDAWTAGTCLLGKCVDRRYPDAVCGHSLDDHRREIVRLRRVVQRIGATNITHLSRQYRAICKRYGRASAEIARLRGENARLRTEEREEITRLRARTDSYRQIAATRPDSGVLARLARAAGVSPDSGDVVGAIEAAIRAGRDGTVIADAGDTEPVFAAARADSSGPSADELDGVLGWLLGAGFTLYRAPSPAPAPLQLGDVVTGDRAVSAPVGTTLGAKSAAVAAVHTTGGWSVTGMGREQDHEEHVRINEWVVLALPDGNAS